MTDVNHWTSTAVKSDRQAEISVTDTVHTRLTTPEGGSSTLCVGGCDAPAAAQCSHLVYVCGNIQGHKLTNEATSVHVPDLEKSTLGRLQTLYNGANQQLYC